MDGQEIQIARAYADSFLGMSGSTEFAKAVLLGDKATKTDFHSINAQRADISRNAGKTIAYAILYGAGLKAAKKAILTWHPTYDDKKAEACAKAMIKSFKGEKSPDGRFYGGMASKAFNKMIDLMMSETPYTPILDSQPSHAIRPANNGQGLTPGLCNHSIQACGSSFGMLSCALLANHWLFNKFGIKSRFTNAAHDEHNFLVLKQDTEKTAYLMQIGHAWCWSLLHYKLGIYDMPVSVAFASGINVDKVWRKSPDSKTATPTFDREIKPGKEYTMSKLIDVAEKANYWGMFNE